MSYLPSQPGDPSGLPSLNETLAFSVCRLPEEPSSLSSMASEDIAKLAETLAKTQVAGGQLSFKGKSLKLNTAEDGKCPCGLVQGRKGSVIKHVLLLVVSGPFSYIITLFVPVDLSNSEAQR